MDSLSGFSIAVLFTVPFLYLLSLYGFYGFYGSSCRWPHTLDWAGRRKEIFSKTRACIREIGGRLHTLSDGYTMYNKNGQSFIVPDPGFRPQVMVPKEHIGWLMDQPGDVLSGRKVQEEKFAFKYIVPTFDLHSDLGLINVIRRDLTRNLGRTQADIFEEMRRSIDATMGLEDASWREVSLFPIMQEIVFRSTLRVLVGLPLCRDEKYLRFLSSFAVWLGFGAVVVGQLVPWFLSPLLGLLVTIPVHISKARSLRHLTPIVSQRMENIKRMRADSSFVYDEPKDVITWYVMNVLDGESTRQSNPETVAEKLLFVTLGAVHTTIVGATNTFLDLLSSDPELGYYGSLRDEAAAAFSSEEEWGALGALAKLPLADSAIRERLRRNPPVARGTMREVVHKDGLTLPDGNHLPRGTWIGVSVIGVQTDDRFYSKPEEYDPFRFARARAEPLSPGEKQVTRNVALATSSDVFLAFGYGRHSCPGRWFAAHLLKMMLAYITLHYDIQPLDKRPVSTFFGDSIVPSRSTKVKVRRRM